MYKSKLIKMGVLSMSAGLVLAACADDAQDTEPVDDGTEQVEETEDPATDEGTTEDAADEATSDDTTDDTATPDDTTTDSQGLEGMTFEMSLEDAINTFYETFGSEDINIDEIQFNRDDGRFLYEFEGWDDQNDYELDLNAENGEIVQQEQDEDSDTDEDSLELDDIITPEEAMNTALEAAGSGYVEEWDLEVDDGLTIYDIEIEGAEDQEVDAQTGDLVN